MNLNLYFKPHIAYAVTISPPDNHQFFGRKDRLKRFINFVNENLLNLPGEWEFITELSEPRGMQLYAKAKGPRLHLHGVIIFTNKKEVRHFLLHEYYKITRWASIDIDTVEDLNTWTSYMMKQRTIMRIGRITQPITNSIQKN